MASRGSCEGTSTGKDSHDAQATALTGAEAAEAVEATQAAEAADAAGVRQHRKRPAIRTSKTFGGAAAAGAEALAKRRQARKQWQRIDARVRRTSHTINVMQSFVEEATEDVKDMEIEALAERLRITSKQSDKPISRDETLRQMCTPPSCLDAPSNLNKSGTGRKRRPSRSIVPMCPSHIIEAEMSKPSPLTSTRALQPITADTLTVRGPRTRRAMGGDVSRNAVASANVTGVHVYRKTNTHMPKALPVPKASLAKVKKERDEWEAQQEIRLKREMLERERAALNAVPKGQPQQDGKLDDVEVSGLLSDEENDNDDCSGDSTSAWLDAHHTIQSHYRRRADQAAGSWPEFKPGASNNAHSNQQSLASGADQKGRSTPPPRPPPLPPLRCITAVRMRHEYEHEKDLMLEEQGDEEPADDSHEVRAHETLMGHGITIGHTSTEFKSAPAKTWHFHHFAKHLQREAEHQNQYLGDESRGAFFKLFRDKHGRAHRLHVDGDRLRGADAMVECDPVQTNEDRVMKLPPLPPSPRSAMLAVCTRRQLLPEPLGLVGASRRDMNVIDLSGRGIGDDYAEALAAAILVMDVHVIRLRGNRLTSVGCARIIDTFLVPGAVDSIRQLRLQARSVYDAVQAGALPEDAELKADGSILGADGAVMHDKSEPLDPVAESPWRRGACGGGQLLDSELSFRHQMKVLQQSKRMDNLVDLINPNSTADDLALAKAEMMDLAEKTEKAAVEAASIDVGKQRKAEGAAMLIARKRRSSIVAERRKVLKEKEKPHKKHGLKKKHAKKHPNKSSPIKATRRSLASKNTNLDGLRTSLAHALKVKHKHHKKRVVNSKVSHKLKRKKNAKTKVRHSADLEHAMKVKHKKVSKMRKRKKHIEKQLEAMRSKHEEVANKVIMEKRNETQELSFEALKEATEKWMADQERRLMESLQQLKEEEEAIAKEESTFAEARDDFDDDDLSVSDTEDEDEDKDEGQNEGKYGGEQHSTSSPADQKKVRRRRGTGGGARTANENKVWRMMETAMHVDALEELRHRLIASSYTCHGTDLQSLFQRLDKDHGGALAVDELQAVVMRMLPGAVSDEQMDWLIGFLDLDHDGEISFTEFSTFLNTPQTVVEEHLDRDNQAPERRRREWVNRWVAQRRKQVWMQQPRALHTLDLSHNRLGNAGSGLSRSAALLERMLTSPSMLKNLDLSDNNLGDFDVCAICDGLRVNKVMECLDLSHNEICADGASALGAMLMHNCCITSLSLRGNTLRGDTGAGAARFIRNLSWNRVLRTLDLAGCSLRGKPFHTLAAVIFESSGVKAMHAAEAARSAATVAAAAAAAAEVAITTIQKIAGVTTPAIDSMHDPDLMPAPAPAPTPAPALASTQPQAPPPAASNASKPMSITHLDLSHTSPTEEDVVVLAEALEVNHGIHLHFDGNNAFIDPLGFLHYGVREAPPLVSLVGEASAPPPLRKPSGVGDSLHTLGKRGLANGSAVVAYDMRCRGIGEVAATGGRMPPLGGSVHECAQCWLCGQWRMRRFVWDTQHSGPNSLLACRAVQEKLRVALHTDFNDYRAVQMKRHFGPLDGPHTKRPAPSPLAKLLMSDGIIATSSKSEHKQVDAPAAEQDKLSSQPDFYTAHVMVPPGEVKYYFSFSALDRDSNIVRTCYCTVATDQPQGPDTLEDKYLSHLKTTSGTLPMVALATNRRRPSKSFGKSLHTGEVTVLNKTKKSQEIELEKDIEAHAHDLQDLVEATADAVSAATTMSHCMTPFMLPHCHAKKRKVVPKPALRHIPKDQKLKWHVSEASRRANLYDFGVSRPALKGIHLKGMKSAKPDTNKRKAIVDPFEMEEKRKAKEMVEKRKKAMTMAAAAHAAHVAAEASQAAAVAAAVAHNCCAYASEHNYDSMADMLRAALLRLVMGAIDIHEKEKALTNTVTRIDAVHKRTARTRGLWGKISNKVNRPHLNVTIDNGDDEPQCKHKGLLRPQGKAKVFTPVDVFHSVKVPAGDHDESLKQWLRDYNLKKSRAKQVPGLKGGHYSASSHKHGGKKHGHKKHAKHHGKHHGKGKGKGSHHGKKQHGKPKKHGSAQRRTIKFPAV